MHSYIQKLLDLGQIRTVSREVDPRYELAAVLSCSQQESEAPVLFSNVKGTKFPVIANLYGSHNRLCELIGTTKGNFCRRWLELADTTPPSAEQYRITVPEPDDLVECTISDLPHITYRERDAGAYITAGVFLANNPDTGVPNLSFSRSLMVSDAELRVRLGDPHDLTRYQSLAEAKDHALDVAILIGPPPEIFLAGCASIPYDADELAVAAQVRGEAIPMRQCKTIDLVVPDETEIVIEGRILPKKRAAEGPFGEFMGYYTQKDQMNHVFEVTRVVARKNAYFQGLLCGSPDDLRPLELSFATRTYRALVAEIPGILDVSCNPMLHNTVVRIKQMFEGHAQKVMMKVFGSNLNYNNICTVVDEDVDIHDFRDVWWAFITRARVDARLTVIENVPGFYYDKDKTFWGRLGIDATKPFHKMDEFERTQTPGQKDIKLSEYLD